jgi:hypothetical protein
MLVKEKYNFGDLGVDGADIIKLDLKERVWGCELDSFGSGLGTVTGSCEHNNELSGYIKGGLFIDRLSYYQLLKRDLLCVVSFNMRSYNNIRWENIIMNS